jgi:hypothetical protein
VPIEEEEEEYSCVLWSVTEGLYNLFAETSYAVKLPL